MGAAQATGSVSAGCVVSMWRGVDSVGVVIMWKVVHCVESVAIGSLYGGVGGV